MSPSWVDQFSQMILHTERSKLMNKLLILSLCSFAQANTLSSTLTCLGLGGGGGEEEERQEEREGEAVEAERRKTHHLLC